jgi:hypothetical protein
MKKLFYFVPMLLLTWFTGKSNPFTNPSSTSEQIRMNLYGFYQDSSTYTLDGTLTRYSDSYSNDVDINDSRKMYNSGENISMMRDGYNLIVECRQTIVTSDTIFFRMWGMQKKSYRMEFIARNLDHPGLEGYLEDSYLKTSSPIKLNDTTRFTILINNDAGSYAQDRFRVVFKTATPVVPVVHFTTLQASQLNSNILINWNTENENNNIKTYFVQKSLDGIHFSDVASLPSQNSNSNLYNWTDHYPPDQVNYYRIRTAEASGVIDYSKIIKVMSSGPGNVTLYPNPATGNNLNLRVANKVPGKYKIRVINSLGSVLSGESFIYNGGTSITKIPLNDNLPTGIYQVEVVSPAGEKTVLPVVL